MQNNIEQYEIYIVADNDEGVLVKVCNLFAARGFSIETLHAQPINAEKSISSITITALLPSDKILNIKEKILQIVPVREVKIFCEKEVL